MWRLKFSNPIQYSNVLGGVISLSVAKSQNVISLYLKIRIFKFNDCNNGHVVC